MQFLNSIIIFLFFCRCDTIYSSCVTCHLYGYVLFFIRFGCSNIGGDHNSRNLLLFFCSEFRIEGIVFKRDPGEKTYITHISRRAYIIIIRFSSEISPTTEPVRI